MAQYYLLIIMSKLCFNTLSKKLLWSEILAIRLTFGITLAKLIRVCYIFLNPTSKKRYTYLLCNLISSIISTSIIIVLDIDRQVSTNNSSCHCVYYDSITNNGDSYITNKILCILQ